MNKHPAELSTEFQSDGRLSNEIADEIFKIAIRKSMELSEKFNAQTTTLGEVFQFLANDVIKDHMLDSDTDCYPYLNED